MRQGHTDTATCMLPLERKTKTRKMISLFGKLQLVRNTRNLARIRNAMLFGVYAPVDSKHTAPVVANAVRGLCSGGQLLQCLAHGDESLSDA